MFFYLIFLPYKYTASKNNTLYLRSNSFILPKQCFKRPAQQPNIKRQNVNPYGDIVTSYETFEAVIKSAREKELKNKQKVKKG